MQMIKNVVTSAFVLVSCLSTCDASYSGYKYSGNDDSSASVDPMDVSCGQPCPTPCYTPPPMPMMTPPCPMPAFDTSCLARIYGGFSVAYGKIQAGNDNLITSALLEPLLSIVVNSKTRSGGLCYRYYGGFLLAASEKVWLGSEGGYCNYPKTTGSINNQLLTPISGFVRETGYGVDLLFNVSFFFIPEVFFAFKPGVQFAQQKNLVNLTFSDLSIIVDITGTSFNDKFRKNAILPEVVLTSGYNFTCGRFAIGVDVYYQHVFGNDDAAVHLRINSRDAFGAGVEVRF